LRDKCRIAGKLADWLTFLKAEKEEEFKMVTEKNVVIKEAYCKLQVMSEDEANRMIYEARLKAQRDEYSRIRGALQKGLEQGHKEGRTEGQNMILELVRQGYTAEQIVAKLAAMKSGNTETAGE
jgi:predicted transposase/invertase (TIGR01784 family)